MKFTKIQKTEKNVLECNEINNDLLFRKYSVKYNDAIFVKENQFIILIENGKILDIEENEGIYLIEEGSSTKNGFSETWGKIIIKKSENIPLSVVFLNRRIIRKNKYFIDEPIKYIEYDENGEKEFYIKLRGSFDFFIKYPIMFINKVIGLRNHYSKQELIEQIRKYVVKSIEDGIKELSEKYKLDIDTIQKKSKELKIKLSENDSDKKILEYGIKLNYFDIDKVEITEKKRTIFKRKK